MSGHSKWSKIKHQKGAKDAKRGELFTKLGKDIAMSASEGGGDPDMNFSLRLAIEKAKQANMPKDNIERAVKKGTGELAGDTLQRVTYEAYGQAGVALIIDTTTDNTNRTVSDVKKLLESKGGKMAEPGSVLWQFEEKGLVVVSSKKLEKAQKHGQEDKYVNVDKDEVILEIMDIEGVEDVHVEDEIEVLCPKNQLKKVHEELIKLKLKVESAELVKIAKEGIEADDSNRQKVSELVESLEENEDVNSVWTNIAE